MATLAWLIKEKARLEKAIETERARTQKFVAALYVKLEAVEAQIAEK